MNNKMIAGVVVGALVVGGGSFYGGTEYAASQTPTRSAQGANSSGRTGGRFGGGPGGAGGFTAGTIVAMDPTSITIQLGGPNATSTNAGSTGSKIVLFNASTQIGKFTTGAPSDLAVGALVTVSGSTNTDGSITAQMIQIRPAGMGPRGGGQ